MYATPNPGLQTDPGPALTAGPAGAAHMVKEKQKEVNERGCVSSPALLSVVGNFLEVKVLVQTLCLLYSPIKLKPIPLCPTS